MYETKIYFIQEYKRKRASKVQGKQKTSGYVQDYLEKVNKNKRPTTKVSRRAASVYVVENFTDEAEQS